MRRVTFALFPGCEIMDVAGPMQAFYEATALGTDYQMVSAGTAPTLVTAQGLRLTALEPLPPVKPRDRVIVPGYPLDKGPPPRALIRWLRAAHESGAEICSVCTGAFALGHAGLLDGRRCTTHWRRVEELAKAFPRARVVAERLFVEDGQIVTSAGITAGIDMTLSLLERDGGPLLASAVAREMVVYLRRDGEHSQKSVYLDYQTHLHPGIHRLQQYLASRPDNRDSMTKLAEIAGMSERNLSRVFRRATGISVHEFRRRLRLARVTTLLRNPELTIEAIASECGFSDARQLRRIWKAAHGNRRMRPRG